MRPFLKNVFLVYLISGTLMGILVFFLIIIHRYNEHLINAFDVVKKISENKRIAKDQTSKMEAVLRYFGEELKIDTTNSGAEKLFFKTLDDIKTNLKGAIITVAKLEELEREKKLPLDISVPVKDYKMIVEYMNYLQSLRRIPSYRVGSFSISKGQEGVVILKIHGDLRAPSLKTGKSDGQ